MRTFIDSLKARKAAASEGGFSLIDVVVTVAIIVALSVGGFIAYTGLVNQAKVAAVGAAADQVYTAALVQTNDGGIGTLDDIEQKFNASSNGIDVDIIPASGTGPTATPLTVQAWNTDTGAAYAAATIKAERK